MIEGKINKNNKKIKYEIKQLKKYKDFTPYIYIGICIGPIIIQNDYEI